MDMTPREYQQYVQRKMKKSPLGKDVCLAFFVGGAICVLGQAILDGWMSLGLPKEDAGTATSCSLVALSSLLTGLNLYNKLARFGGAGTLVPITGFSNAVTSPALDFKSEGSSAYSSCCRLWLPFQGPWSGYRRPQQRWR